MKMATHEGRSHEKTRTPKRVPKLIIPGTISKKRYNNRSLRFFISPAFEIFRYSLFSILFQGLLYQPIYQPHNFVKFLPIRNPYF